MEQSVSYGAAPIGHCSYCNKAVWPQEAYHVVQTMFGTLRLCADCAAKEPYAWTVDYHTWINGTTLPEKWKRTLVKRKKGKRG